jgi:hypothetical protein
MATIGLYMRGVDQAQANEVRRKLNEIAARHGFRARRGPTKGEGNIAALLLAMAEGEIVITPARKVGKCKEG